MKLCENVAPLNSLILVMDRAVGKLPDPDRIGVSVVTATPSCLTIGTLCSDDGETVITLSDEEDNIGNDFINMYGGVLQTPNKLLSVCTVLDEPILEMRVQGIHTRVQIWANASSEPDEITILALPCKEGQ